MTPFIVANWLKSDIQLVSYHHLLRFLKQDPFTDLQSHELTDSHQIKGKTEHEGFKVK